MFPLRICRGGLNKLSDCHRFLVGQQIVKFSSEDLIEKTNVIKISQEDNAVTRVSRTKQDIIKHVRPDKKTKIKVDPKDTTVVLFPGQGSQFVGMGSTVCDIPNVKHLFEVAEMVLGYDLLKLCLNGPIEELTKTQLCQPAIFVTSLAAVEYLRNRNSTEIETCVSTAGFSIGEITALVFAGAMSFEDGLRLIKIRAESMQYASEIVPSAMATVFLYADAQINLACQAATEWSKLRGVSDEYAVCSVANYLFPHCKVIAGHEEAIKFIELNGKDFGIKRMRRLPVSGAFHTALMSPAKKVLEEALKKIKLEIPLIPVYSNYDAQIYRSEEDIRKKLAQQVCCPVKWEQILHNIYDRRKNISYPNTYECGPGTSLSSTLAMVNREARQYCNHVKV